MLSLDELKETAEFIECTDRERMFVATYISNGHDGVHAVRTAYNCKNDDSAKKMAYRLMAHIRIIMVLARHRGEAPKSLFLRLLRRASYNRGMSASQLHAFRLYAEVCGWITAPKPVDWEERREKKKKLEKKLSEGSPLNPLEYDLGEYENPEKPDWMVERDAKRAKEQ